MIKRWILQTCESLKARKILSNIFVSNSINIFHNYSKNVRMQESSFDGDVFSKTASDNFVGLQASKVGKVMIFWFEQGIKFIQLNN
jgi:hypothetical protein